MASHRSVCFSCREPVQAPSCVGCGALQPPPASPDPFVLFGLPHRYHIDAADLDVRYRTIARATHPDRFVSRPAVERRMALQWTAALNEARRVLKDDRTRARWLATGRSAPRESGGPALDPAFLAEIFEWRERDEDEPGVMRELATASRQKLFRKIETEFSEWEGGSGTLDHIEDHLNRLTYVEGLLRSHPEA